MDDTPKKVEITLSPELYAIAQGAGDMSAFIEAAVVLFISSTCFYDYLYLNKLRITAVKKARYMQELTERLALLDEEEAHHGLPVK